MDGNAWEIKHNGLAAKAQHHQCGSEYVPIL